MSAKPYKRISQKFDKILSNPQKTVFQIIRESAAMLDEESTSPEWIISQWKFFGYQPNELELKSVGLKTIEEFDLWRES